MVQCSRHDTPSAIAVRLTDLSGHDLDIWLTALGSKVLTDRRLGESLASKCGTFHPH